MAGNNNSIQENKEEPDSSLLFQWDEESKLYYHPSSGFYHDPTAGWYYSSKDGLYYKFENGNYILWETDQADQSYANQGIVTFDDNSVHDESDKHVPCDVNFTDRQFEGYEAEEPTLNDPIADTECLTNSLGESLPPPSEWLEDTLIELYLSGYANQTTDDASGAKPLDNDTSTNMPTDGVENDNADDDELEEGEWIPDETHEVVDGCGVASDEDEEEMWRAQYGQAIHLEKEQAPDYPVVDLWDWSMVTETKKSRKRKICRLVGRLIKRSSKLHPSMPSSGRVLKTAPICEAHLDLVRVRSGRVYKLRSPKVAYLASLSSYDSSNPTKDWGFPDLSMEKETQTIAKSSQHIEPKMVTSSSEKRKDHAYRDRAAERRTLHGGFGVGPGQKKSADEDSSTPVSATPEEAAAEALNMSFGDGSYARRMLEKMGWKEGEALGSSMKGLTEPLQTVGNKGSSGLGWNQNRNWKHA
ncbi:D111/G-patch domain-containing protein [Tanacetum coccineum]